MATRKMSPKYHIYFAGKKQGTYATLKDANTFAKRLKDKVVKMIEIKKI